MTVLGPDARCPGTKAAVLSPEVFTGTASWTQRETRSYSAGLPHVPGHRVAAGMGPVTPAPCDTTPLL